MYFNPDQPKAHALFFHGAGAGSWQWAIWQRVFAAYEFSSAAVDLEPSIEGIPETSLAQYRQQCRNFTGNEMSRNRDLPIVLIGASMGAALAADMALDFNVAALVRVNPIIGGLWAAPNSVNESGVVPWRRRARLDSSRRALGARPLVDHIFSFRRWRDESAQVLHTLADAVRSSTPASNQLVFASELDTDIDFQAVKYYAEQIGARFIQSNGLHIDAVMGRSAFSCSLDAVNWLNEKFS